jgi:predicted NAD-dependent protein-ADP-ribosyltransferase YbiA (DUF1768 family)
MVVSRINSKISYPEIKNVDASDLKTQVDIYKLDLKDKFGIDIFVAIGSFKNTFEAENVIYLPLYLVKFNNKVIQIGIYEIIASKLMSYIGDTDDINVEKLGDPLLYSFVTKEFLLKYRLKPDEEDVENEEAEKEKTNDPNTNLKVKSNKSNKSKNDYVMPDHRSDMFVLTDGIALPTLLTAETIINAKKITNAYTVDKEDNWVQQFMKNKNYNIVDNEGGGDCLFATIRDAFSSIGQQTSVSKIRHKLSEEINEEVYQTFKEKYDMFRVSVLEDTKQIKELAIKYENIKQKFTTTIDRNEQKVLLENAKNVREEHDNLVKEKTFASQMLNDYKFMKGIDSVDKLKKELNKCSFWAEGWSIATLERILNIKLIILSSDNYSSGDIKNVLECGQIDKYVENQNAFNPEYYIMVVHAGSNYKLVGYKEKLILKFQEIPHDIRMMISDKCMETNSGLFGLIPDFKSGMSKNVPEQLNYDDLTDSKLRGLYDDNIVFLFYSKSANKLPGKGAGETIPSQEIINFKKLSTIPDWRKKLSNFWVQFDTDKNIVPITIDNHKWASVEHYYQGSKFKEHNPDFYLSFSLDSGTELAKDPAMAKSAGGKSGKYKGELLRPTQVKIDPDFFGKKHKEEMYKAQYAKFTQIEELKNLLIATNNAKLTHHVRAQRPVVFDDLMLIRDKFKRVN